MKKKKLINIILVGSMVVFITVYYLVTTKETLISEDDNIFTPEGINSESFNISSNDDEVLTNIPDSLLDEPSNDDKVNPHIGANSNNLFELASTMSVTDEQSADLTQEDPVQMFEPTDQDQEIISKLRELRLATLNALIAEQKKLEIDATLAISPKPAVVKNTVLKENAVKLTQLNEFSLAFISVNNRSIRAAVKYKGNVIAIKVGQKLTNNITVDSIKKDSVVLRNNRKQKLLLSSRGY